MIQHSDCDIHSSVKLLLDFIKNDEKSYYLNLNEFFRLLHNHKKISCMVIKAYNNFYLRKRISSNTSCLVNSQYLSI